MIYVGLKAPQRGNSSTADWICPSCSTLPQAALDGGVGGPALLIPQDEGILSIPQACTLRPAWPNPYPFYTGICFIGYI